MRHGTVITFYSYKGGVGRSFALANIAALLYRWGHAVLCIDWDIEAPGLNYYLNSPVRRASAVKAGLVDLLEGFPRTKELDWMPCVQRVGSRLSTSKRPIKWGGRLDFISAGSINEEYSTRAQHLDWTRLYKKGLGQALERSFEEMRNEYDFILIDGRTGITDFAGVITAQLPDILAFLFTANEQSLQGSLDVARRALAARNNMAIDRPRLLQLPIPARFEMQLEHRISANWQRRFVVDLREFYEPWLAQEVDYQRIVQLTTIPYVPFWSFGERLAVLEEMSDDPQSVSYSLSTIAALLSHKLGQTRLLSESRDDFVSAARRAVQSEQREFTFFLSYARNEVAFAGELVQALRQRGFRVFVADDATVRKSAETAVKEALNRAQHMIVLVGPDTQKNRFIDAEIRSFLRQAASDETPRLLVPCLVNNATMKDLPPLLRSHQAIDATHAYDAADRIQQAVWRVGDPDDF